MLWILGLVVALVVGMIPTSASAQEIDDYLRFVPLRVPPLVGDSCATRRVGLFNLKPQYPDLIDPTQHKNLLTLAERFAPYLILNTSSAPVDWRLEPWVDAPLELRVDAWDISSFDQRRIVDESYSVALVSPDASADVLKRAEIGKLQRAFVDSHFPDQVAHPSGQQLAVLYIDYPGDSEETWREIYRDAMRKHPPRRNVDLLRTYFHPLVQATSEDCVWADRQEFEGEVELVLQYWFFYPFNDGGNNHEGDWEHLNVIVAPRARIREPVWVRDVTDLFDRPDSTFEDRIEEWSIKRVEYYFHNKVMTLDYSDPNVYLPLRDWEADIASRGTRHEMELTNHRWFWDRIRDRAFSCRDRGEPRCPRGNEENERARLGLVNNHPIAYVGGDNIGTDQLLHPPGARNEDSHGLYPFPGRYQKVGPVRAAEDIADGSRFDHHALQVELAPTNGSGAAEWTIEQTLTSASGGSGNPVLCRRRPHTPSSDCLIRFDDRRLIRVLPDAQELRNLLCAALTVKAADSSLTKRTDCTAPGEPSKDGNGKPGKTRLEWDGVNHRDLWLRWSWLVLPIRWGYPAVRSPGAGLFAEHSDTGNLAPVGPAFNRAWNRAGAPSRFEPYVPDRYSKLWWEDALSDRFWPELGWLNFLPAVTSLSFPLDAVVRLGVKPGAETFFKDYGSAFIPRGEARVYPTRRAGDSTRFRALALSGVRIAHRFPDRFADLLRNGDQIAALTRDLGLLSAPDFSADRPKVRSAWGVGARLDLAIGTRWVTEHSYQSVTAPFEYPFEGVAASGHASRFLASGAIELREYRGATRYNLSQGMLQPFIKFGYGYSWYRVVGVEAGQLRDPSTQVRLTNADSPWFGRKSTLKSLLFPIPLSWPNTVQLGVGFEAFIKGSAEHFEVALGAQYRWINHRLAPTGTLVGPDDIGRRLWRTAWEISVGISY